MQHDEQRKNISHYNSFEVFEDIYESGNKGNFNQLEMPHSNPRRYSFFYGFALFLFIVALGLSIHPLLSYTLKTPYPLVVIGGDSMQPVLKKDELVVVKGLVDIQDIQTYDVVLYRPSLSTDDLSIERVTSKDNWQVTLQGDAPDSPAIHISADQIIGKVISHKSIHLPLLNKISNLLAKK
jgi:signal peptidase I